MRDSLLFVLVSMGILLGVSCSSLTDSDLIAKRVSLQYVKSIHLENGGGLCSSVFVNYKNKVRHVTNSHCCQQPVYFKGKLVEIVKQNPITDLCELNHNDKPKIGINMSNNEAEIGDRIYIAGFPIGGHEFSMSTGFVTSKVKMDIIPFRPLIITNAFATFGNSGGGVISSKGLLVGITDVSNIRFNTGGYIPIKVLKDFLN